MAFDYSSPYYDPSMDPSYYAPSSYYNYPQVVDQTQLPKTSAAQAAGQVGGQVAGVAGGVAAANGITSALGGGGAMTAGAAPIASGAGTGAGIFSASAPAAAADAYTAGAGLGTGTGAATGGLASIALPAAGIAAGGLTAYESLKGAQNAAKGNKMSIAQQAALALPTFGLSLAYNHIPGLTHKSTKQREEENTSNMQGMAPDNQAWQDLVTKSRQAEHPELYPDAPKVANPIPQHEGVIPEDMMFSAGMLNTFGPDYLKYSFQQQKDISKALLDNKLFDNKHGDTIVTDQDLAKQLADKIVSNPQTGALASALKGGWTPPQGWSPHAKR